MTDQPSGGDVPAILPQAPYDPAEIMLIGMYISEYAGVSTAADVAIKGQEVATEVVDDGSGGQKCVPKSGVKPKVNIQLVHTTNKSIALIQAYIFEGSYYELPKPKIMVVSGTAEPVPGKAGSLLYWRMNKLDRTTEISVEDGLLETLILEANLPGRRSPNSYAANMQMAHRSGRLNS